MNQHNKARFHEYKKTPTAPRFSLEEPIVARHDLLLGQQNRARRVLVYPTPADDRLKLRDTMTKKHLVLGRQIEARDSSSGHEHFAIPMSARPIAYDAVSTSSGRYVYGDEDLFFDLGCLLSRLSKEGEEFPFVIDGDVGKNVATLEFTRLDEAKILLVPGFELAIKAVQNDDEALSFYNNSLNLEFGLRFESCIDAFQEGFVTTL